MPLSNGNQFHVRIDRLACDHEGNYYVCDYKTNNQLKAQEELDEDKQLAMYSIWIKQKYPDAQKVKLVWYFLAHDKEMISERSDEQLEKLKQETEELIKEIEACGEFPTNISTLCDYCQYKQMCPAWKHEVELEQKSEEEFKEDDGLKLVDEYSKLEKLKKDSEEGMEKIRAKLVEFSKQKGINVVWGTDKKASIKEYYKVIYPDDKDNLIQLIKDKGIYEEVSSVNYLKLGSKILKNQVPEEIIKEVKTEKSNRVTLSRRK